MKRTSLAVAVGLALGLSAGIAAADIQTYTISSPNVALSPYTGPYATLTVNRADLTHATITFNSLTNGGYIYLMGDGSSAAVNVNATAWTLGTISGSNSLSGFTPGPYSDGGSGTVDGFGVLNQTINSFDGFTHSSTQISFGLTNTSGSWATAGSVLIANDATHNTLAAIHAFACATSVATPCTSATGATVTGFAGNGGSTSLPEPGALGLLGMVLATIGLTTRRHKRP